MKDVLWCMHLSLPYLDSDLYTDDFKCRLRQKVVETIKREMFSTGFGRAEVTKVQHSYFGNGTDIEVRLYNKLLDMESAVIIIDTGKLEEEL